MDWLEHRIPPPLVAIITGLLMWLAVRPITEPGSRLWLALLVALAGVAVCLAGVASFRRARTTVNPLKPESASSLVVVGIYRHTRNPMYLGFAIVLLGWCVFLGSALAVLGVAVFVLYIGRFQIRPEERALRDLFGAEFDAFCGRVRRWV
ncbi:isoprenylcysteine carboxylmethyltransferase family protein [Pseudomonas nicosulfuronedens]|uniref:Isoprenylcysteine carboxylmethyltransferase family protein n=1 Tax=Pseudomonas nicosulfuronedens TaxID=2571105 RepID=A0A5R9QWC9_9PSED|nr:isoprenylcysteine carboxylmethyltransferase family protein [Pseudomonas nicosulfuronedens]MDH1011872.1 isoprenylcysteine carboxylmethyltransferase family protein [Pseudomonas nicosulfuronedens]MDH1981579.1 isoprenylcysteine carboxylmethyltransferase family protein [Pseudomonas nicosulfuronedens]MDH2027914.1 isoprenylcysteine carboxylmethyltransferase family protein [Pseudomonas nicosulfuronedens]TLX74442.1 isoprenylcysteine carboxylmethyltransferase family protein [Pseudomonas nicosulfuroned